MTSVAGAPSCPRCGEEMVLKTAERGSYAGQQFWACPRFPKCWGRRGIAPNQPGRERAEASIALSDSAAPDPAPGESAQAIFERRSAARLERIRAVWPVLVGLAIVLMVLLFLTGVSIGLPWLGVVGAAVVVVSLVYLVMDRPQFIEAWRIGAAGERKTASRLAELEDGGFVILHDRRAPAYGGNLDQVAIGPSGVWLIETKSLRGQVEMTGDSLIVAGQPRDKMIEQVYRQATAVQIALRDVLTPLGVTVAPLLCIHRARLPFLDRTIRGVTLVSGKALARTLRDAPVRLTADHVQVIADAANQVLPTARPR